MPSDMGKKGGFMKPALGHLEAGFGFLTFKKNLALALASAHSVCDEWKLEMSG